MSHLTADELSAQLDGASSAADRERAERHLAECETCREALAALAAQEEQLGPALHHDPGDAYFESFAARVEDRIRAAGLRGAQARQGDGWMGWLRSPRRLAWVGAVMVTLAGAGVVMLTSRFERPDFGTFEKSRSLETPPATPPAARGAADSKSESNVPREEARARASGADESGAKRLSDDGREVERAQAKTESFARPPADRLASGAANQAKLDEQRQDALAQPEATAPKAAAKDRGDATTQRLMGSRRTAAGEDIPLRRPESAAAPAPAPAPGTGTVLKKPAAPAASAAPDEKAGFAYTREADRAVAPTLQATPGAPGAPSLCGKVLDGSGHAVARAEVTLVESGVGVSTDDAGHFCIAAAPGDHEVAVMAVGFRPTRLRARAGAGEPDLDVRLAAVSVLEKSQPIAGFLRGGAPEPVRGPSLAKEPVDVFAALPDSLRFPVREAQAMVADGRARRSATRLDQAAAAWEAVRPRLGQGAIERAARYRLAEARYLAWQVGPGETRRAAAAAAVRSALQASQSSVEIRSLRTWQRELGP